MNTNEQKDIIEKVIVYFTDELGYPIDSIKQGINIDFRISVSRLFKDELLIYFFGEAKIVVGIIGTDIDLLKSKEKLQKDIQLHHYSNKNISFYMFTNGKNYYVFDSQFPDITLSKPLSYQKLLQETFLVHERIFQFLEKKRSNEEISNYQLRSRNDKNRLDEGLWFLGKREQIILSFWEGKDYKNKTPNIYLELLASGDIYLIFTSKSSIIKGIFLEDLASIIGKFKQTNSKGKPIHFFKRKIGKVTFGRELLDIIGDFLKKDKKIIDTFITNELELKKNKLDDLGFIKEIDFEKNLAKINKYRKNRENYHTERVNVESSNEKKESLPIKLKKLHLQNISHFRTIEIDLDSRIICFLGENGTGKSSILRALILGLIGVDETSEIDVERPELQQLLRIVGQDEGKPIFANQGFIRLDYEIEQEYTNIITFEEKEGGIRIFDDFEEEIESFGATDTENHFKSLIIGFSQVQGRSKEANKNGFDNIKKPHVKDILPLLYDEEDNRFQELSNWIIRLHGESLNNAQNEKETKVLEFVFEVISDIIGDKISFEKANHLDKMLWVKVNHQDAVLFDLISQGFKNVFAWIGHFMKRLAECNQYSSTFMDAPAIVLIDEIDTYLHPKWQVNMLRVLADRFPNTQFIVSTHAPLMASHLPTQSKAVYIIKENEILTVPHVYGKEISSIYYNWMGIKSRPQEIQQKIDDLFVALDREELEQAKEIYNALENNIGTEDGDLREAKSYMELIENQD